MAKTCLLCGKKLSFSDNYSFETIDNADYYLCTTCNEAFSYVKNTARWNDQALDDVISENIEYVRDNLRNCIDEKARDYVNKALSDKPFGGMTFLEFQKYCAPYFPDHDTIFDIDNVLRINNTQKVFAVLIKGKYVSLHSFDELADYSIDEDGQVIASSRAGSAAIGALLFGAAGAIVGSAGSTVMTQTVQDLDIILSFKGFNSNLETIHLLANETVKGSEAYIKASQTCKRIIFALKQIMDLAKTDLSETRERGKSVAVYAFSVADEILKFKGLLDQKIITQEEFDKQKAKLLDLEY